MWKYIENVYILSCSEAVDWHPIKKVWFYSNQVKSKFTVMCELLLATSAVNNTGAFHYGGQNVQVFKKTAEKNKSVQKTSKEKQ